MELSGLRAASCPSCGPDTSSPHDPRVSRPRKQLVAGRRGRCRGAASEIGQQLGQLFAERKALPAPAPSETRLALPRATASQHPRREEQ
jgi:hypothetical protein